MKEITAIIRMNKIGVTKQALLKEGFPSFACRKVVGRGKKKVDFSLFDESILEDVHNNTTMAEDLSEFHRLVPKRMISMVVNDEDVQEVVTTIIEANRTNNQGDGKIFVTNVSDVVRVRTGEKGAEAL